MSKYRFRSARLTSTALWSVGPAEIRETAFASRRSDVRGVESGFNCGDDVSRFASWTGSVALRTKGTLQLLGYGSFTPYRAAREPAFSLATILASGQVVPTYKASTLPA